MAAGSRRRSRLGAVKRHKGVIRAARRQSSLAPALIAVLIASSCGGPTPASSQSRHQEPTPSSAPAPGQRSENVLQAPANPRGTPAGTTTPGAPTPKSPASLAPKSDPVTEIKNATADLKAAIDYSQIDVGTQLSKIGKDPRAIAAFVQNEIRYEPYMGALRGARGTLLARAGNSLDRALLLSEMLRSAGYATRFAEGSLSESQATQLVRAAFSARPAGPQLDPSLEEMVHRAQTHFTYLSNTLHNAGFTPPDGDAGAWMKAVREAQTHYWVQLRSGDRWVDVDTSSKVPYGATLTTSEIYTDEVNPQAFDQIEIRLDVETIHGGTRSIRTVLQHSARTADLAGLPMGVFHTRQANTVTPVLVVGDTMVKGEPFATTTTVGVDGIASVPAINPFDTVTSSGSDRLSALWIKFHISGPSGDHQAVYTLVDTEGASARQANASPKPLSASDVTAVMEALDGMVGFAVTTGDVPPELPTSLLADKLDPQSDTAPVRLLAMYAFTECSLRGALQVSFQKTPPLWYIDSPNITVVRAQPSATAEPAMPSLDLVLKAYRNLRPPDDPLWNRGPFGDYLAAGVIDHTVERWLLGSEAASGSVGSLFERLMRQHVYAKVILPSAGGAGNLPLSQDGKSRVSAALSGGNLVVLPPAVPQGWKSALGWWSIDPVTGWTQDTVEGGEHGQPLIERAILYLRQSRAFRYFCVLGALVATVGQVAEHGFNKKLLPAKVAAVNDAIVGACAIVFFYDAPSGGGPPSGSPPGGPLPKPTPGLPPNGLWVGSGGAPPSVP